MKKWLLVLLLVLTGCTARLTAEMSIMKQWDRPGETYKTETNPTAQMEKEKQGE